MSNVRTDENPASISDIASIGHKAQNKVERRLALEACLNGQWINRDIGRLERVDSDQFNGWTSWRWARPLARVSRMYRLTASGE